MMNCYVIQHDIVWENPGKTLPGIFHLMSQYSFEKNSLVVLPEMFSTGFSMNVSATAQKMDGPTIHWMQEMASKFEILLAGSVAVIENEQYFNRFLWVFPDGSMDFYDKRHLFSPGGEHEVFTQGQQRKIINFQGFKLLPLVCYDLRFPVWTRNQKDYEVIVYTANWPKARQEHWNTLLAARAIENQAYVIAANRIGGPEKAFCCGNSQIIDFKGRIIQKATEDKVEILNAQLSLESLYDYRNDFAILNDADSFEIK